MTQAEFLIYLVTYHRLGRDSRFYGDALLLELITTPPLGFSIYERKGGN